MNETNELEKQLGSWKPRRPSAAIKRRLFPAPRVHSELVRMLNWLAPATVCMFIALAAFRQENGSPGQPSRHDPSVDMMLSNESAVVYLASRHSQVEHNVLAPTLEFTNHSDSGLNNRFTPFIKPNE
jgi:hypothetical protein